MLGYLILTHCNPAHLERLINSLYTEEDYFIVHVDKLVVIDDYVVRFNKCKNVIFVTDRYRSSWGSFELIEATLSALRKFSEIKGIQRVLMLSGQDYPIKPLDLIKEFLALNPQQIFMDSFLIPCGEWSGGGKWRFPAFEKATQLINLYGGSQWISFPAHTIQIIFKFLSINPSYITYFRSVAIPDESFFQTLFMNCGVEKITENIAPNSLHLILWGNTSSNPNILTEADLGSILDSDKLLARKFDQETSLRLLNYLDDKVLKLEEMP